MQFLAIRRLSYIVAVLGAVAYQPVVAQTDAFPMLEKIQKASRSLNYQGVFMHDQGVDTTSSKIAHVMGKDGVETSWVQLTDGRQIDQVRVGKTLKVIDKNSKSVLVEEVDHFDQFPGLIVPGQHRLKEFYQVEQTGQTSRVADRPCFILRIVPKDRLRYGYELCVDQETFLLLRVHSFNEQDEIIEKASFATISYQPEWTAEQILHLYAGSEWTHVESGMKIGQDMSFSVRPVSGFSLIKQVVHLNNPAGKLEQLVFSDGLTSVSVFLEPLKPGVSLQHKEWEEGSLHIIKQQLGAYRLMVLGEVPLETLKIFAENAALKK